MARLNLRWPLGAALGFGLGVACSFGINPDTARFSCAEQADCGAGFECKAQTAGGGLCFRAGECSEETCDGKDNDCDGVVDDGVPAVATPCDTGLMGVCNGGQQRCEDGTLRCAPNQTASAELCDGLDNDCDGQLDEDFDLTRDSNHCGACGTRCDAGTSCASSRCAESACADGVDNDLNSARDCEEESCRGAACSATDAGANCGLQFDAGLPDGGMTDAGVRACVDRERACDNGLDDDGDGKSDCADADCDGRACSVSSPGKVCAAGACP